LDTNEFAKLLMAEDRKSWQNPTEIVDQIRFLPGTVVADLGCGPGYFAIPVAAAVGSGGKVFAVDDDPVMLEHFKKNMDRSISREEGCAITPIEADIANTGIAEGTVDVVLFANLLHDLPSPDNFLSEVHRILKPSGRAVDIDWHKTETNKLGPPMERRLSENESRMLLRKNGYRIIHALNPGPYHYGFVCKGASLTDSK
jgi:ubiquinone/menaquinone biosynthesis C-methylase UbiE